MALVTLPRQYLTDISGVPIVGANAYFYQSGTSTLITVYEDGDYSVALPNPVPSSSAGRFPAIYVNHDTYSTVKIKVTDDAGVELYTDDEVPTSDNTALTAAIVGAALYPRTAAEISAGITPSSYAYPEGDVRRYGAALNGSTVDDTAFQNAIAVQAAGGSHVIFPPGNARITGLTFGSNVKIVGSGNKTSYFTFATGAARTALKAANTALFNDGAVFEDFGIIFSNSADIGVDLTSVSRASLHRVRIWGDAGQATRRGTGVLFDASVSSCYANTLHDCDIRDCTKNLHYRKGANSNQVQGGQILNGTDCVYQEGTGGVDRIDNCGFFGTRIETSYGDCIHLSGDVWGWGFHGCRIEAYQSGSKCVNISAGDVSLPPTMFLGCTVAVSSGATDYDFSTMTGRVFIWGQDQNQYQGVTGGGSYHFGQATIYVGNPSAAGAGIITVESSDTNADLTLTPKGTGAVGTAANYRGNALTVTGATPTGTGSQISFGTTVGSTVGAAGGASALPATPAGYMEIDIGGTKRKVPYYPV
ncbi:MAG: glycosyl hydrolase family 28-related protein [Betaproteobacteria bacterium]